MNTGWSSDLSYDYLKKIYSVLQSGYRLYQIADVPPLLGGHEEMPGAVLRHDVDLDLGAARRMAVIENQFGISATYMVMTRSRLYSIRGSLAEAVLSDIMELGHDIGLHHVFDESLFVMGDFTDSRLQKDIENACNQLESVTGRPVRSVSYHRPPRQLLRGALMIAGRINAYARELMEWYLSDSEGVWRQGEPLGLLSKPGRGLLQLLIHPIWWGERHLSPPERLQEFFQSVTEGYSPSCSLAFDFALSSQVGMVRGLNATEKKGERP